MRRPVLALVIAALSPLVAEAAPYANARFGYGIEVPVGFEPAGRVADNGDGAAFRNSRGTQALTVWGGMVGEADFEAHAAAAMALSSADGWGITYQAVTPGWVSYSATRNGQVLYARQIALCDGQSYAAFALQYPERDIAAMNGVVDRLAASLRPLAGAC